MCEEMLWTWFAMADDCIFCVIENIAFIYSVLGFGRKRSYSAFLSGLSEMAGNCLQIKEMDSDINKEGKVHILNVLNISWQRVFFWNLNIAYIESSKTVERIVDAFQREHK